MKTRILVFFLSTSLCYKLSAQELFNFYNDLSGTSVTSNNDFMHYGPPMGLGRYYDYKAINLNYNGEYVMDLGWIPWGNQNLLDPAIELYDAVNQESKYLVKYEIEVVSFPFSVDCAFPSLDNPDGGCGDGSSIDRTLNVPDDLIYHSNSDEWIYPTTATYYTNKLARIVKKNCIRIGPVGLLSNQDNPECLVSASFAEAFGPFYDRTVLPHTILKHTVTLFCGSTDNVPINSFSFLVDLTRGKMREYPFTDVNAASSVIAEHDIIIRPEIYAPEIADATDYSAQDNCDYYKESSALNACPLICGINILGSTIDYTPFAVGDDNDCLSSIAPTYVPVLNLSDNFSNGIAQRLPFPSYSLILSTFPRSGKGSVPAGYTATPGGGIMTPIVTAGSEIVHRYTIDKNIDLYKINPIEQIIYNPSEVFITSGADNFKFPSNYTFKTIRATFPYKCDVAADNIPENGGTYNDPREVPVTTDLFVDSHDTYGYPTNDHKYASVYHLESGSKVTVQTCVKLFDCTFDVQTGSELFFEDWFNQINVNRFGILLNGGKLTKGQSHFYFQDKNEQDKILEFQSASTIEAGSNVTSTIAQGPYTVETNADVTFVANDEITLSDGFTASAGSEFDARISPVTIPPCSAHRPANTHTTLDYMQKASEALQQLSSASISPNPTNQNTEIKFSVNSLKYLSLKIFDAYGREVKTIIDNIEFKTGSYTYNFDTSILNPGVYYCKLFSGEEEETMKLIKIN
jgi:hypothetical protein